MRPKYIKMRDELMAALSQGGSIPDGLHSALDYQLHQLQDDHLQAEYSARRRSNLQPELLPSSSPSPASLLSLGSVVLGALPAR